MEHMSMSMSRWSNMSHPCYGLLPVLRTIEAVPAGGELTVHYQLNMQVAGGSEITLPGFQIVFLVQL